MDSSMHHLLSTLQTPTAITDLTTLLTCLSAPLDALGLLPPRYRHLLSGNNTDLNINLRKYVPQIQHALLTNILPTWDTLLHQDQSSLLVEQYFCPDAVYNVRPVAGEIALCGYATLVSFTPLPEQALALLERLVREYPLDRLFFSTFRDRLGEVEKVKRGVQWEDCVRNLCMVPAKVANAFAGKTPTVLENAVYFSRLSVRTEELIFSLSSNHSNSPEILTALSYLFTKLVNNGLFPARPPTTRSQPSFFMSTLPHIRARLQQLTDKSYTKFSSAILLNLPTLTLQSILTSLFSSLSSIQHILDGTLPTRALIKREAGVLQALVGWMTPSPEREELWEIASGVMLNMNMDWNESHARIFVCWISDGDSKALHAFLDIVLETWSSSEYVKHSLLSRHKYTTALFLLTISYLTPASPSVQSLVTNPSFIRSITTYISHNDHSVRRCGMLVAEEVARLAQKKLEFEGWEGEADILKWARDVRQLTRARDVDVDLEAFQEDEGKNSPAEEVMVRTTSKKSGFQTTAPPSMTFPPQRSDDYDSDDSLTGYASPTSSRSSSPDPKELEEIAKDPTLNVGSKKVPRPVYLAQLGELLRGKPGLSAQKPNEPHEADRIEMVLNIAEELLRKKKAYGTELDENAVNLVYGFLSLNDPYELEGFSEKRQGAMNALVACAPKKAAPALIEEFFKNQYSADQRFVALNALAMGARELASLPIPPSLVLAERTAFPSKMLPAPLHNKYMVSERPSTGGIPLLMDEISNQALNNERSTAEHHPELSRERRLRIQKPSLTKEIAPHQPHSRLSKPIQLPAPSTTKFIDVAAEFFIVPLVNRFWIFLRDEQAREERSSFREGRDRYRGAGTGMILNSVVLAQLLRTLGILVHASQNSPEWLAIIAPNALEVAVTIGTRPISHLEVEEDESEETTISDDKERKEASVLTAALEVALVVLNSALEIDGGKVLGLEHTTLVLAIGEWAEKVFASLEKGLKVPGGGGVHEAKLRRATAGVLLKVDELASKWRRSMLDTR